jgi:uncharacterized coiled-coil DUF342 family protein
METLHEEGIDTLSSLEQRIQRAVELLATLRDQNKELARQLAQTQSERDEAQREAAEARNIVAQAEAHAGKLSEELDLLRDERKQVKSRIEKLLGQMDLLSAS